MTAKKETSRSYTKYNEMPENVRKAFRNRLQFISDINDNGCWIIKNNLNNKGYASVKCKGISVNAHRASYLAFVGPITENLFVCHKCDVRNCVNPDHLFLGTHRENMLDAYAKGRIVLALTEDSVNYIREMYNEGWGCMELSRRFGVDHETIRNIFSGKTYRHVPYEAVRWAEPKMFSINEIPVSR